MSFETGIIIGACAAAISVVNAVIATAKYLKRRQELRVVKQISAEMTEISKKFDAMKMPDQLTTSSGLDTSIAETHTALFVLLEQAKVATDPKIKAEIVERARAMFNTFSELLSKKEQELHANASGPGFIETAMAISSELSKVKLDTAGAVAAVAGSVIELVDTITPKEASPAAGGAGTAAVSPK